MRKSLAIVPFLSAVVVVSLGVGACSAKKPNPPMSPKTTTDGGLDGGGGDGGILDGGFGFLQSDAAVATGPAFFTDAGAPSSSGGTTAPPALTEQALDLAIDAIITTAAPKVAPKMDKEGQPGRATLKEGEHFSMMVTLSPGRCYTIVGSSPPGQVSQLDLKLYGPPLFNVEAGKSAAADKAMPVIAKGTAAMCPILPIAVPYKIDAGATKGAGRIGIHVYARNK